MRSASRRPSDEDRTTRARIRDAAITCFAEAGVAATSVRAVAAAAGVSPALVIHHFGSKEGLQAACDAHVAETIYAAESSALAQTDALDPFASLRRIGSGPPLLRYLARMLVEDSATANALVDAMVANGVELTQAGAAAGAVHPARDDEYARVVAILVWSLGALVLHRHVERLLGGDLTGDLLGSGRYLAATVEILGRPVFTTSAYEQLRAALAGPASAAVGTGRSNGGRATAPDTEPAADTATPQEGEI